MLDIHSHILPGVDHGSRNMEQSVAMLRAARAAGIDRIIATPHVYSWELDTAPVDAAFAELAPVASDYGIRLQKGYECNLSAIRADDIPAARRFCVEGTDTLLLEFSFDDWPPNWERIIYALQLAGLKIVIAHPERYRPLQRNQDMLRTLFYMDCLFQLNAASFCGGLFSPQTKLANLLLKQELVHFIASDAHDAADYADFTKAHKKLGEKRWPPLLKNLFEETSSVSEA